MTLIVSHACGCTALAPCESAKGDFESSRFDRLRRHLEFGLIVTSDAVVEGQPLAPTTIFGCEPYSCLLSVRACAGRQIVARGKTESAAYAHCLGCRVGQQMAARAGLSLMAERTLSQACLGGRKAARIQKARAAAKKRDEERT